MSKKEVLKCIQCGEPMSYCGYQYYWGCTNPNCPPGRSEFPFNWMREELLKKRKEA